jgi:hypothetical protein
MKALLVTFKAQVDLQRFDRIAKSTLMPILCGNRSLEIVHGFLPLVSVTQRF